MNDIKSLLLSHFSKYPHMEIRDFAKLIYQNEFGCGHLVTDKEKALAMITDERKGITLSDCPHTESIGNGYSRLYLSSPYSVNTVATVFMASANAKSIGTVDGFLKKFDTFKKLCLDGELPYSVSDADEFIKSWCAEGRLPFSHSERYKGEYAPRYRVILEKYVPILPVLDKILSRHGKCAVVAIDGRCGAGKTTFATMISELLDCVTIHMDDFFLPPELRTKERLLEAGGNIHYERFYDEVVSRIKSGLSFSYGVFDCSKMAVTHTKKVNMPSLIVVEGSYSLNPRFGDYADVTVFCDVSPDVQKKRIISRNGEVVWEQFKTRWIPMEEKYLSAFNIKSSCDFTVTL